jgi:hypothetical protein
MFRKKLVVFGILVIFAFSLYVYLKPQEHYNFSKDLISSNLPSKPEWVIDDLTPEAKDEIRDILSLKYQFLGYGKQAFAFVSEDEKFVVKFFNMSCVTPSWKDFFYPQVACKKERKLKRLFFGYKNGYQDLKEETGLIWIHLTKTNDLNQVITLMDPHRNELHVDADSTIFVIQKKAEPILERLGGLYKEGKTAEADDLIKAFYSFIEHRASKGFYDRDKVFHSNYGFVGNQPIQFDLGFLHKGKNSQAKQEKGHKDEVNSFRIKIEKWKLNKGYP